MRDANTRKLAIAGLLSAIIVLLTAVVSIPLPGGHGYINLGDAGVLTAAFVLGGGWGAIAGGVASALADMFLGYTIYAPATLVIKAGCALLAAFLLRKMKPKHAVLAFLPAALLVPVGYFLYETVLYGFAAAIVNVPLNALQCVIGAFAAQAVVLILAKGIFVKR